ncbi:MAG: LysR family transcriptional regulator [Clostridia bacterium]|nr:LysR family transcriptional regulator [Clostridia bacterium]
MVNLELYRVFCTVARCGSLTKAAEELYISQPAVSQAIKQLERELNRPLFIRTHKGMELSEMGGKQIIAEVEQAINLLDNAEKKFSGAKENATGFLRICASDSVSTHFLLPIIKEYHEKFPDVSLTLHNRTSTETIALLKDKKGDIGFVNLPIDDREINLMDSVMQLHDTFVCNEKFFDLTEKEVELKRLQDYPLLMLESSTATRQAIVSYAYLQGVHLQPEIEIASLELMTELAKNGLGIACIPREFVLKELEQGTLKEIKTNPTLPSRAIGLALPKDENMTVAVKEFIALVNGKIGENLSWKSGKQ